MRSNEFEMITPLFIFSLPRAGSTLLQRVLMSHSKISSVSEPWLLLPLVHMLKSEGIAAIYSHQTCKVGIEDTIANMQGGKEQFDYLLRDFVSSVYSAMSRQGSVYFVDKTPRYYMIIPEIARLFPDAKLVFLFRNPMHIYASIIATFGGGSLSNLFHHAVDLNDGPELLAKGYEAVRNRAFAIQYEEFVTDPKRILTELLQYLNLKYEDAMLTDFASNWPRGRLGDPTAFNYNRIDTRSLDKWKTIFSNHFRKRVLRNYLLKLDHWVLSQQGYNKADLLRQVDGIPLIERTPLRDYYDYYRSALILKTKAYLFFSKAMRWTAGKHIS